MNDQSNKQVTCPICGYRMPIFLSEKSECEGISVTCKNKICKEIFEIKAKAGKQITK